MPALLAAILVPISSRPIVTAPFSAVGDNIVG